MMKNSRRDFLKFSSGLVPSALLLSAINSKAGPAQTGKIPILQGGTSESATTLVLVVPALSSSKAQLQIAVFDSLGRLHDDWNLSETSFFPKEARIFDLDVTRMRKDLTYTLTVYLNGSLVDQREFQSFESRAEQIILGSCSNESIREGQKEIWRKMESIDADAFFYFGDAVYADSTLETVFGRPASMESAHEKFVQSLRSLPHYFRSRLIPQFNIWDDHDYAWNNGDENHPNKLKMQKMFRAFFPQKFGPSLSQGPQLSFAIKVQGIQYLFVDGRSERNYSDKQNKYVSEESKNWILQRMKNHSGPSAIVTGSQLCGFGTNRDSIEQSHATDFIWFKQLIEKHQEVLFFISGDTHYSHLQVLNWGQRRTAEITSSGLHSFNFTGNGKRDPAEGQLGFYKGVNFCTLRAQARGSRVEGEISCISLRGIEFQFPLFFE